MGQTRRSVFSYLHVSFTIYVLTPETLNLVFFMRVLPQRSRPIDAYFRLLDNANDKILTVPVGGYLDVTQPVPQNTSCWLLFSFLPLDNLVSVVVAKLPQTNLMADVNEFSLKKCFSSSRKEMTKGVFVCELCPALS